ncbi:hypothetical protein DNTS_009132 [Danionella cerebrum]|nr:hypothetical protein DNTS_009132 [Danionella translucida]
MRLKESCRRYDGLFTRSQREDVSEEMSINILILLWVYFRKDRFHPSLIYNGRGRVSVRISAGGVMDVNTALPEVLKTALIHDGLARGIREAAKALDKRQAHLCVLAANCDEPMYVKLVEALCAEHQINLIKVDDNKKLGEWVGLCKIDREGKPRKVVGCSCVVIKDYGKESQAKDVIEEYFKSKK